MLLRILRPESVVDLDPHYESGIQYPDALLCSDFSQEEISLEELFTRRSQFSFPSHHQINFSPLSRKGTHSQCSSYSPHQSRVQEIETLLRHPSDIVTNTPRRERVRRRQVSETIRIGEEIFSEVDAIHPRDGI